MIPVIPELFLLAIPVRRGRDRRELSVIIPFLPYPLGVRRGILLRSRLRLRVRRRVRILIVVRLSMTRHLRLVLQLCARILA